MADQYWDNVVLALPMDGANGSTTFTDISPTPKAVTRYGNAVISTAQSKFGGASAYFGGTGDYLDAGINSELDISSGDFTVEGWLRPSSLSVNSGFYHFGDTSSNYNRIQVDYKLDGSLAFWIQDGSETGDSASSTAGLVQVNNWYHVAATQSGTNLYLFLNGALVASSTRTKTVAGIKRTYIGASRNGGVVRYATGYIDDFRITKGLARYTANFTPPTVSYLADAIGYGSVATLIDQVASTGGTSIIGVAGIIPSQEIIGGAGEVLVALGTADISPPLHQAEATGTVPVVGLGDFSPPIEQANAAGTIPVTGQGSIVPSLDAVAAVSAGITATGEIIPSLDNVASAGTSAVVRAATVEQKKSVVGSTGSTSITSYGAVRTKDCKLDGAGRSNRWVGQVAVEPGVESVASSGTLPIIGRVAIESRKTDIVAGEGAASAVGAVMIASRCAVVSSRGLHVPVGQGVLQGKYLRLSATGTSSIKGAAIVSPSLSRVKASRYARASLQSLAFGRGTIITGTVASPSIEPIHFTR